MRVIKYPEPEKEELVVCPLCKAELAYVGSDCFWKNGVSGDIKFIVCPCCQKEIKVDYTPYPIRIGQKTVYFEDSSWAE